MHINQLICLAGEFDLGDSSREETIHVVGTCNNALLE